MTIRERVWLKYNKRCAYCGNLIEMKDMQIDHIVPKRQHGPSVFDNLNPSCRRCNHYKRADSLKGFRIIMKGLHNRIQAHYINKVALDYGIIVNGAPFDGIFYFEKHKTGNNE